MSRTVTPDATRPRVRRVLVVEDEEASGLGACRALRHAGCEATLVRTCAAAREELRRIAVDAVVVDLGLPDGEGWSLVEQVRADGRLARIPVVVTTGVLDTADVLDRAAGLQCHYLGKPFPFRALITMLDQAAELAAQ